MNFNNLPTGKLGNPPQQNVRVTTRGGGIVVAEFTPDQGSYFERKIDETSVAEVTGRIQNTKKCEEFGDITIGFDLEWWRGDSLAWAGPVEFIRWDVGSVYVQAQDLTSWWSRRIAKTHSFEAIDPVLIVQRLHEASMIEDPVAGFDLFVQTSGEVATLNSYAEELVSYGDLINGLADHAIDYTAYGRNVIVGASDFLPELGYYITDKDWIIPPSVEAKGGGGGLATRIYGTDAVGNIVVATADESIIALYGLIERVVHFDQIEKKEDLKRAVKTHLDIYSYPYYVNFSQGNPILLPRASVPFEALIPGLKIGIEASSTCKTLQAQMRIASVRHEGSGAISLGLTPVGTVFDE